jgi:hypothetical protein
MCWTCQLRIEVTLRARMRSVLNERFVLRAWWESDREEDNFANNKDATTTGALSSIPNTLDRTNNESAH